MRTRRGCDRHVFRYTMIEIAIYHQFNLSSNSLYYSLFSEQHVNLCCILNLHFINKNCNFSFEF